jgi:alkylated DNA nucleotide flippase Atl1
MMMDELCRRLSVAHKADVACPITTGIFAWLVAHAAQESSDAGAKRTAPWWRLLKTGGLLNPKYPGGGELQRQRLEAEGHKVLAKGRQLVLAQGG